MIRDKDTIYAEPNDPNTIISINDLGNNSFVYSYPVVNIDNRYFDIRAMLDYGRDNMTNNGVKFRRLVLSNTINNEYVYNLETSRSVGKPSGIYFVFNNKVFKITQVYYSNYTYNYTFKFKEGSDTYIINVQFVYGSTGSIHDSLKFTMTKNNNSLSQINGKVYLEYYYDNIRSL